MSWRARGCPVSALGLVGGALAGRHRASPILQQDTSFEAELPVDRCVRGERASVCKTTSNHPASQTWRPCLLGHLRCIAAHQIALLELYTLPEAVTERWFATLTVLRRFSAKLGTACSPLLERRKRSVRAVEELQGTAADAREGSAPPVRCGEL